jgi:hypothetical protein
MNDNTLDILLSRRKKTIETTEDIEKKFKHLLKTHRLIKNINCLAVGDIISHISYKSKYLSQPGIIYDIEYHIDTNGKKTIKKIKLMNTIVGKFWIINLQTRKYYIFESLNMQPCPFDTDQDAEQILLNEIKIYNELNKK